MRHCLLKKTFLSDLPAAYVFVVNLALDNNCLCFLPSCKYPADVSQGMLYFISLIK